MKNIKWIIGIIILALIIIFITSNKDSEQSIEKTGPIKIGHLAILSGPAAGLGEAQMEAFNLLLEETNAEGGINGRQVELVIEDYAYDSRQALSAYQTVKTKAKPEYYLQDGSSGAAVLAPIYVQDGVVNIASSATTPAYFDESPLTCRLSITADKYGLAMVNAIENQFGSDANIAFIMSANEYGEGMLQSITTEAKKKGMSIVMTEKFEVAETDYRTQITKLAAAQEDIDVLITVNVGSGVGTMFRQFKELGFTKQVLSDNWSVMHPSIQSREDLNGVLFIDYEYNSEDITTQSEKAKNFVDEYQEQYDRLPNAIAANGYDALALFLKAIAATNDGGADAVANYFVNEMGTYEGVSGSISFDNSCEVNRTTALRTIVDGKVVSK